MPALIFSTFSVMALSRLQLTWIKRDILLPQLAGFIYIAYVLSSSYSHTEIGSIVKSTTGLIFSPYTHYLGGMESYLSGYSAAFFFVCAGWHLRDMKSGIIARYSKALIILGVISTLSELTFLKVKFDTSLVFSGYLLGTALLVIGIVSYAVSKPTKWQNNLVTKYGKYTLGIYGVHYFFVGYIGPLIYSVLPHPFSDVINPVIIYLSSLTLAVIAARSKWLERAVI
jgi:fucose 4-O-acetylase-like acetyltransferase